MPMMNTASKVVLRRLTRTLLVYALVAGLVFSHPLHEVFRSVWPETTPARSGTLPPPVRGTGDSPLWSPFPGTGLPPVTWVPVPLPPASLLPGWVPEPEQGWLVPLVPGMPIGNGAAPDGFPDRQRVSALPSGDPWMAAGQVPVHDPVNTAINQVRNRLIAFLEKVNRVFLFDMTAAEMSQAQAHHTQQQIQDRLQHMQNMLQHLKEKLALGKQWLVLARQLTTKRGIFAVLREQFMQSDDLRQLIATLYDIQRAAYDLRQSVEEGLHQGMKIGSFFAGYRNWYQDANPETVLDAIEHFVVYAGPVDRRERRELLRQLAFLDPSTQKKFEQYTHIAKETLENEEKLRQLREKSAEHRKALDKPNPIVGENGQGKSEEEMTDLNPRKDTPADPPAAGSPERRAVAPTDIYAKTIADIEDKQHKLEEQALNLASELGDQVTAVYEHYMKLLELAQDAAMLEDEMARYFTASNQPGDECLDPFCLAIRFFYLR